MIVLCSEYGLHLDTCVYNYRVSKNQQLEETNTMIYAYLSLSGLNPHFAPKESYMHSHVIGMYVQIQYMQREAAAHRGIR